MRLSTKEKIRKNIPNNKLLRYIITKIRIQLLYKNLLPSEEVKKNENNILNKKECVEKWERHNPALAKKLDTDIEIIINKNPSIKKRPDWEEVLTDLKFCKCAYGFLPYEYICYEFEHKSPNERCEFVSDLERIKKVYQMNDIVAVKLFMDKGETYNTFKDYYHRECLVIEKKADYPNFQQFVKKHPQFVKKQVFESIGNSIELIDINTDKRCELELFSDLIKNGKHILEEKILQSQELANLNNTSVNTVRCITLKTKNEVLIPSTFVKVGRNGSFVDNGGAGGILVGIDVDTGVSCTDGVDEYAIRYDEHPDNGVPFKGIQFPDWEQMKKMCIDMASKVDSVRFIGWDLAHTKQYGWVVVEGNGGSQFIGPQCIFVSGIRKKLEHTMNHMQLFS